jgi:hypothetical protein
MQKWFIISGPIFGPKYPKEMNDVFPEPPKSSPQRTVYEPTFPTSRPETDINSKSRNGSSLKCLKLNEMYSWLKQSNAFKPQLNVLEGLKSVYKSKILPLEEHYLFHEFHLPKLEDTNFDAKL